MKVYVMVYQNDRCEWDADGFDELYLRARFSNGEALYGRVENTSRAKLMQAVSPRV